MALLHSFKPVVDRSSRVLVLGSMPGPEALRKGQYYGFEGNHFWTVIPAVLGLERPALYRDRIRLVKKAGIALWDVLASCERKSALDSDIRNITLNPVPALIQKFPGIRAVFVNGGFAHKTFVKGHGDIGRPVFRMPSTSPANAATPVARKIAEWRRLLDFLE